VIVKYNFLYMDLVSVTRFINGFLMIGLPILLGIFLVSRFKFSWKIWLIGGMIFIISQILHLPFNTYLLNPIISAVQQSLPGAFGSLMAALLLGLSAGVFEECARYGMFRWWLEDKQSWRVAVLAGAGHGGVEAILLGLIVLWVFINMVALRNASLNSLNLTPQQLNTAQQQIQAYWSVPWYESLFGVIERIFIIPFHIMASVLVLQVFTHRPGQQQLGWLGLAIFLHTMMDASSAFIAAVYSPYAAEAVLGGLAVINVVIIFVLRQPEAGLQGLNELPKAKQPPIFTPQPIEETSENLQKTRYQ
jgi:uncharacterized membrane protein YhfC